MHARACGVCVRMYMQTLLRAFFICARVCVENHARALVSRNSHLTFHKQRDPKRCAALVRPPSVDLTVRCVSEMRARVNLPCSGRSSLSAPAYSKHHATAHRAVKHQTVKVCNKFPYAFAACAVETMLGKKRARNTHTHIMI